jgi:hypothetical protein
LGFGAEKTQILIHYFIGCIKGSPHLRAGQRSTPLQTK